MDKLVIRGGTPLHGRIPVSGAKNAALPILMATIVAPGEHRLQNVAELADTSSMLSLLGRIGCPSLAGAPPGAGLTLGRSGPVVRVDTSRVAWAEAPYDLVRKMRASVLALGPLLARCGEAHVSLPGGCAIGVRPIDQHLKGLEKLGCSFTLDGGYVHGRVDKLVGAHIHLDMPTVTGTENILMAAVLAEGETTIDNAAAEPEVEDLARFLTTLGARIEGAGTATIRVQGVSSLRPAAEPYLILPDRIEAGTYLVAGAMTGGDVRVDGARPGDLAPVLSTLEAAGCGVERGEEDGESWVRVWRDGPVRPVDVETLPHPGFPTDMQAQVMALLCLADGSSRITETIFENRFMHVAELLRLGAHVEIAGNTATVHGVGTLRGAAVMATDLRASASLVLAGLAAEGVTEILRIYHLDRGYERLEDKLLALGATVRRAGEERPRPAPQPTAFA